MNESVMNEKPPSPSQSFPHPPEVTDLISLKWALPDLIPVVLNQGCFCPPRAHLAMPGDILVVTARGGGTTAIGT